jgi:hypothetical protein
MITFETTFDCKTKQDVVFALQEIIDWIEGDYESGILNVDDGSWRCVGEEEQEDD